MNFEPDVPRTEPPATPPPAASVRRGDLHVGRAPAPTRAAGQGDQLCGAMDVPPVARIDVRAPARTSRCEATPSASPWGCIGRPAPPPPLSPPNPPRWRAPPPPGQTVPPPT